MCDGGVVGVCDGGVGGDGGGDDDRVACGTCSSGIIWPSDKSPEVLPASKSRIVY